MGSNPVLLVLHVVPGASVAFGMLPLGRPWDRSAAPRELLSLLGLGQTSLGKRYVPCIMFVLLAIIMLLGRSKVWCLALDCCHCLMYDCVLAVVYERTHSPDTLLIHQLRLAGEFVPLSISRGRGVDGFSSQLSSSGKTCS